MVRPGEIFIHISEPDSAEASTASVARSSAPSPVQPTPLAGLQRPGPISAASTSPFAVVAR
jgi:hypothetical protein